MGTFWEEEPTLIVGTTFEAAYPETYHSEIVLKQNAQMTKEDRSQIIDNIFQHSTFNIEHIFDHVRNTDQAVHSSDVAEVQKFQGYCKEDITTLEAKISGLLDSLQTISRELTETSCQLIQRSRQLRVCEYVLSRPKHLPHDVLEQIFISCWESQDRTVNSSIKKVPFQVASVCHRWRAVALSTSVLWSDIRVWNEKTIARAKTWITRCRSPMLTLTSYPSLSAADLDDLSSIIANSGVKVQKLDLCFNNPDHARAACTGLFGRPCDDLKELVLRTSCRVEDIPKSVQRFYSHNPPSSWTSSPPPPNLTVLCITMNDLSLHWSMVEHIFFHCPNLEQVTLRTTSSGLRATDTGRLGSPLSPHPLQHLVYFGISDDSPSDDDLPDDFLGNFSFPKLRIFEYKIDSDGRSQQPWLTAHPFLTQIRRLAFQSEVAVSIEDFRALFTPASSLEEFSIYTTDGSLSSCLQVLSSSSTESPGLLLPSLKSVHFGGWEPSDTTWHSTQIVEFIKAWSSENRGLEGCLNSLNFQIWPNKLDTLVSPSILDDAIREANPDLKIRLVRYSRAFLMVNIPLLFEVHQKPFNATRVYEVMDVDNGMPIGEGVWRTSPIYSASAEP